MLQTGSVNQLLFQSYSHDSRDGDFCLPQWIKHAVFVFSRTTKIQFKDKLSARSLFVHLLKHSVQFTIMKAQHLSNVAIIIFSSLFFFCIKSHACACCVCLYAPETKHETWLSAKTDF